MSDEVMESKVVAGIHAMGFSSLKPEEFDGLEIALRSLIRNRSIPPPRECFLPTAHLWTDQGETP